MNIKIQFPVDYESNDGAIYDAESNWIADVDSPLREDVTEEDRNKIGEFIAEAMNARAAEFARASKG